MVIAIIAAVVLVPAIIIWAYMQLPQFGRAATGVGKARIVKSENNKDGVFQNVSLTPSLAEGVSFFEVFRKFFFGKSKRVKPKGVLPSRKIDLNGLNRNEDLLVWFGHSSYLLQIDGKRILVDPVFSGHASPLSFTTRSFAGADVYSADDMPEIDYLIITHDHYDHLDYKTVEALRPKVKRVLTALGVGAHLERWGYAATAITELDWNEEVIPEEGWAVSAVTARHFSGRGFKRNGTLWSSFVLKTRSRKIYIGGDSGYDTHFAAIGEKYGPFDLAILENGQYNAYWKYIHMMPEEVVQAAIDLKAKRLLPVHWGKFALSVHDWDEPIIRVTKESERRGMELLHPLIGEAIQWDNNQPSTQWWVGIE